MAELSMKELLESGVHFGHQTRRWNPKMKKYIYGARNGIHILDLSQTIQLFEEALNYVKAKVDDGGTVLFVGTKKQAQAAVREAAEKSGSFFIAERWLGGLLTNWKTIQGRVSRLKELDRMEADGYLERLPKKEKLKRMQERDELQRVLGGIREMTKMPDVLFIVDLNKESIAVKEATKMGIPIVALCDTNCDPDLAEKVIPGNDDAIRAIKLVVDKMKEVILEARPLSDVVTGEEEGTAVEDGGDSDLATPIDAEFLAAFGGDTKVVTASTPVVPLDAPVAEAPAAETPTETQETTA